MKTTKFTPLTVTLIAMLTMPAVHFLLPITGIVPIPWNLLGLLPIAAGIILSVVAERKFVQAGTTVTPFEESKTLVTDGAYRFTRNPMYFGLLLVLVGVGAMLGTLSPFLVAMVYVVVIDRQFIQIEERMLAAKFGPQWLAYRDCTRRWI